MGDVSIAEAKAKFSEIIARVELGETQIITKRGKPVARVVPILDSQPRPRINIEALRRLTDSMPKADVNAGGLMRQMRDEDRY